MERIVVLDFGGQYNQLIARRVREAGVYSELLPHTAPIEQIKGESLSGLILTGGLAGLVAPYCETKPTLAPDLLLEGLYRCYLRAKDGERGGGQ